MKVQRHIFYTWLLSAAVCLAFGILSTSLGNVEQLRAEELRPANSSSQTSERVLEISIVHPGDPSEEGISLNLVQSLDLESNPLGYSLWVNSVICRDKTCDVVLVKLIWDAFGRYQCYEVKKGFELTKLDHVPFSPEDHEKLQKILLNKKSALSEVTKEGLVGPKAKGVDGVAGATVLTLGENVVLGAGYTCYDLWHWANGEVCQLIQEKTCEQTSLKRLRKYLTSKNDAAIQVALKALIKREIYSEKVVDETIKALRTTQKDLLPLALRYLKAASKVEPYNDSFKKLLEQSSSEKVLLLVESLYENESSSYKQVLAVSRHLNEFKNYQEVHRFLTYVELQNMSKLELLDNISKLMDHPKFFFSRRAYFFLKEYKLSKKLQNKVDSYAEKFKDRLF